VRSLERQLIRAEITQRKEEGCDVEDIAVRIKAALGSNASNAEITALYEELIALPVASAFPYQEPSTLKDIQAQRPDAQRQLDQSFDDDSLLDRIYGGWLGRIAGCTLGKPVEGWTKDRIDSYLKETDALPLTGYIPFTENWISDALRASTQGNIEYMDRDDDIDFTILGLLALERHGADLTSRAMAFNWMDNMPLGQVCTAEEVAYRNFTLGIFPPESATYRNPFREWIGAQIRADVFGYAAPGYPEKAAELAYQDAAISHDKNGIYGEMFVAAMIAASFSCESSEEIIKAGLGEIPANCRLADAVRSTLGWCKGTSDWVNVWQKIDESLGHYHDVHTIKNAALVVLGVWYGGKDSETDFETGIMSTVRCGWDTDCTGATVGSILGVKFGAAALPEKWVGVFNDRVKSAVSRHSDIKISELANRTLEVSRRVASPPEKRKTFRLESSVGGIWDLSCDWGNQTLNFEKGTIDFVNEERGEEVEPVPLRSSEYRHPHATFSYALDKGGWEFHIDFSGTINGDRLEGFFNPGMAPVTGIRKV
jgi:ADP-ribosylglycohydrolase